jgi:hypothetical protein
VIQAAHDLCGGKDKPKRVTTRGTHGRGDGTRTELDGAEDGRLERLGEARVHDARLLELALEGLEVVEVALARDLALELLGAVERQPRGVLPAAGSRVSMVRVGGVRG